VFSPGEVIGGKYRVEAELGRGGMGVVVRARHLVLDNVVAIKFLLPDTSRSGDVVRRFLREARAATKITSENVARVFDVETLPNGDPYIVMEHLRGNDLDQVLHESGPLSVEVATDWVLQACIAIAEPTRSGSSIAT
jgi:serine/threonine-protein kinase